MVVVLFPSPSGVGVILGQRQHMVNNRILCTSQQATEHYYYYYYYYYYYWLFIECQSIACVKWISMSW